MVSDVQSRREEGAMLGTRLKTPRKLPKTGKVCHSFVDWLGKACVGMSLPGLKFQGQGIQLNEKCGTL